MASAIAMDRGQVIYLNPKWPTPDKLALEQLGNWALNQSNFAEPVVLATSGSTAASRLRTKLVIIEKKALIFSAKIINRNFAITAKDRWLNPLPRFHVGGLGIFMRAELSGSEVIVSHEKWDPSRIHGKLRDEKISVTSMVPTQIFDLVQLKLKAPPDLRLVFVGGASISAKLVQEAQQLGWPLVITYGMTETSSMIAASSLDSAMDAKFFSEVGLRFSESGILSVKYEGLFSAYAKYDENQKMTLQDPKVEGWFQTEDRIQLTDDQTVQFLGRTSDQIKILGELVDVNSLRQMLPANIVVDTEDDPRAGKALVFYTDILDTLLVKNLLKAYNEKVRPFEKCKAVFQVQQIPRTDLGKVIFVDLRQTQKSEVTIE